MSKKLDQISDANILKTDFKTQNQFSKALGNVGSSQNKNLLNYVKELFKQYIDDRYKGKESDVYLINKELIKRFRDDFSNFITEYQKDVDTNIDLDKILKDIATKEQVDDKIIAEIKTIITSVLKKKLKEHINNQTGNTEKITEIKGIIKKYQLQTLNSREIENIINRTLTNDHPIIKQIKNEFKDTIKAVNFKHNVPAIKNLNFFKSKKLNKIVNKSANKLSQKTFTIFNYKKKPPKIKDSGGMKFLTGTIKVVKKCKDIISKFVSVTGKILNFIGKIYKFVKRLVGVLGMITKLITGIIFNLIKFVIIKPINFLIIKPLKFMVSKIFSLVGLVAKTVFKIIPLSLNLIKKVLSLVSNTLKMTLKASKFILFTPQGMYALGFLLGFLWKKIEQMIPKLMIPKLISNEEIDKLIPDVIFNLEPIFNLVDGIYDILDLLLNKMFNYTDQLENKYPFLKSVKWSINTFLNNVAEKGFVNAFKDIEIIKQVTDFVSNDLFLTSLVGFLTLTEKFITFLYEHQEIAEFLLGVHGVYKMTNLFNTLAPFKIKGNFFSSLLGSMAAYTTYTITDNIMSGFESADENSLKFEETHSKLIKNKAEAIKRFEGSNAFTKTFLEGLEKDIKTLEKLTYTYSVFKKIDSEVDKDTIYKYWNIGDIHEAFGFLVRKYLNEGVERYDNFSENLRKIKRIYAEISNLYEKMSLGNISGIDKFIKDNFLEGDNLFQKLNKELGTFNYKYIPKGEKYKDEKHGEQLSFGVEILESNIDLDNSSTATPANKLFLQTFGSMAGEIEEKLISSNFFGKGEGEKVRYILSRLSSADIAKFTEAIYGTSNKRGVIEKQHYVTYTTTTGAYNQKGGSTFTNLATYGDISSEELFNVFVTYYKKENNSYNKEKKEDILNIINHINEIHKQADNKIQSNKEKIPKKIEENINDDKKKVLVIHDKLLKIEI